jgi:CubicO group peptidase (beta-lactamase class C family)
MKLSTRHLRFLLLWLFLGVPATYSQQLDKPASVAQRRPIARFESVTKLLQSQVDKKEIAGAVVLVTLGGKTVYSESIGMADIEAGIPMTQDTIFRVASMTKPVTSVAVMMLYEEGQFQLSDPISKFLPEFRNPTVTVPTPKADTAKTRSVLAHREITIHDLLTHTSGITYRFSGKEPLSALYQDAGVSDGLAQTEGTLAENMGRLGKLPLAFEPGHAWEYGLSVDVLGRLVEVVSKKPLDEFFRERIFEPLGMKDTCFFLDPAKRNRLAALYRPDAGKKLARIGDQPIHEKYLIYSAGNPYSGPKTYFSGGAGLVSTAPDYGRFLQMLLNGGALEGVRLLKPETVELMTRNQIGTLDMPFKEHGNKFGYGFGIVSTGARAEEVSSMGSYSWGGIFHTYFWVDPKKKLIGILMTQLYPFWQLSTREDFKRLVYGGLKEG